MAPEGPLARLRAGVPQQALPLGECAETDVTDMRSLACVSLHMLSREDGGSIPARGVPARTEKSCAHWTVADRSTEVYSNGYRVMRAA